MLSNPKTGYWTQGTKHRFISFHWLIVLTPKALTHSIWHLTELLFHDWKKKTNQNIRHQILFTKDTFLQALPSFFITLKDDVTVAGIQKGFLVGNIWNPFVGKITLLAALLKVLILPLESSGLFLRVLFFWCLEDPPPMTAHTLVVF